MKITPIIALAAALPAAAQTGFTIEEIPHYLGDTTRDSQAVGIDDAGNVYMLDSFQFDQKHLTVQSAAGRVFIDTPPIETYLYSNRSVLVNGIGIAAAVAREEDVGPGPSRIMLIEDGTWYAVPLQTSNAQFNAKVITRPSSNGHLAVNEVEGAGRSVVYWDGTSASVLPGGTAEAFGMSSAGLVFGRKLDSPDRRDDGPVRWNLNQQIEYMPTPFPPDSVGTPVGEVLNGNDAGQFLIQGGAEQQFFDGSNFTRIDGGVRTPQMYAMNESGTLVGFMDSLVGTGFRAHFWNTTCGLQDLNAYVPFLLGLELQHATDINESGIITVIGLNAQGYVRGFVMTPIFNPADVNKDCVVDPADFNAWIVAFNNQDPAADQNGDGIIDPSDFNAWVFNYNNR